MHKLPDFAIAPIHPITAKSSNVLINEIPVWDSNDGTVTVTELNFAQKIVKPVFVNC
jgi:hypothetical protein